MTPMKLADALPLPVSSTVKMGGASDGLVTGLSRYSFITAEKLNGTSTSDWPSSVSVTAGVVIVPELNAHVRQPVRDAYRDCAYEAENGRHHGTSPGHPTCFASGGSKDHS